MPELDQAALARLASRPGIDPRIWISSGTVDDVQPGPVTFDDDEGYPLVAVTLQPSKVSVLCRVAMTVAGNGEGEWHPIVPGDEVVVGLAGGSERACYILGRLNNGTDKFPKSVAGQDPTTNSFGMQRRRTPLVLEVGGPYLLRQATTGALLSIDTAGVVTVRDGSGGALQLSADLFGYQSADASCLLQIDLGAPRFTLHVGDALLVLSGSAASPQANAISTPGALSISTAGNPAHEHVVSTEALAGILVQVLTAIGLSSPGPIIGAALGGAAPGIVASALTLAAVSPLLPPVAAAVAGAFAIAPQKPPGVPGLGQIQPGIGSAGTLVG